MLNAINPAEIIARQFKGADCYTIDSATQTLYVVHHGKLSVMRFDRPIIRDAERFEEAHEARQVIRPQERI